MSPILIGYFPKRATKRPEGMNFASVEEICSVSEHIAEAPEGWVDLWRHNECWAYDTQELAWGIVPATARAEFRLYAYRMYPVRFEHGEQVPVKLPELHVEALPSTFVRLGLDAVSRTYDSTFECSPLSCNGQAEHHRVNRYCLVGTEAEGFEVARDFSIKEPEPGPYYLVEVWRKE